MKPILVLAGNQNQYLEWARENRQELEAKGFAPRYLPAKTLNHLGYRDCLYTEVGTHYQAGYHADMFEYFATHNILKV